MATTMAMEMAGGPYPVQFDVEYPPSLSRLLIFVKWLLAIPHAIVLYFLQIASAVLLIVVFFAVLITGKYPEGLFKFNLGVMRWGANVNAYVWLLRDEYPPFSLDAGQHPVLLNVEYPTDLNRWMVLIKWLLVIPHLIIVAILMIVAWLGTVVAWFAILFTGSYPKGIFDFVVGVNRWNTRAGAYVGFMTDRYPPFSLDA